MHAGHGEQVTPGCPPNGHHVGDKKFKKLVPFVVKISPDNSSNQLDSIAKLLLKYKIDGVRCDNSQYSVTVWSDTLPTIGINDTFRVNDSFLIASFISSNTSQ